MAHTIHENLHYVHIIILHPRAQYMYYVYTCMYIYVYIIYYTCIYMYMHIPCKCFTYKYTCTCITGLELGALPAFVFVNEVVAGCT